MNKIALIGGGGFIGKNLANFFLTEGYEVLIVNRSYVDEFKNSEIKQCIINVKDTNKLLNVTLGYEIVVWLVNDLVPGITVESLTVDFDSNIYPIIRFLEGQKDNSSLCRFIFISSGGTIYGDSLDFKKFSEMDKRNPISIYGLSKSIAEDYIDFITKSSNYSSLILRPSNVYGNFQNFKKPQGIIGFAFSAIKRNYKLDIFDNGEIVRDFIHVFDLSRAIKLLIDKDYKKGTVDIFNVGSGQGFKIIDIIKMIETITGKNISLVNHPPRNFDCRFNVLNIDKVRNEIDWEPSISLYEGLKSFWDWFKFN